MTADASPQPHSPWFSPAPEDAWPPSPAPGAHSHDPGPQPSVPVSRPYPPPAQPYASGPPPYPPESQPYVPGPPPYPSDALAYGSESSAYGSGPQPYAAASAPDVGEPQQPADDAATRHGALVAFAVGRLAQGRRPEQAFCDLVGLGTDRRLAAIAVCVANGTPWDVAEERMVSFDDVWKSLGPASPAETAGGLLELYGYFDREVELTAEEEAVAAGLRAAMTAAEYLPSGYANQMYRLLRTGRLREALFSLEEMGAQRWPDNRAFWLGLTDAAVRLDTAAILDTELAAVRRRCESRLQS